MNSKDIEIKATVTVYQQGYMDGWAAAQEAERNRPGIHVIRGYRLCDICNESIKDQSAVYEKPLWWEIWKTGKIMHKNCYDAAVRND